MNMQKNSRLLDAASDSSVILARSGLAVDVSSDVWTILPYKGKGRTVDVSWVRTSGISDREQDFIFEVIVHFVRTKAASTAATLVFNIKSTLVNGIPSLVNIRLHWSGLKTTNKKGMNQFFGALVKLGNAQFAEHHEFTKKNLDKEVSNALDPSKGAHSALEFDSLATLINRELELIDWTAPRDIAFFRSTGFSSIRNKISNKLLISIVRRPIQISALKWSDLIPAGASFNDSNIGESDEVRNIGADTLQLRVFFAKTKGVAIFRSYPERYPIHISEFLSAVLMQYKCLVREGVKLMYKDAGVEVGNHQLLSSFNNMPMFPSLDMFGLCANSLNVADQLFTPVSNTYHVSESIITNFVREMNVISDRTGSCVTSSNRIRHTVLTRGAQDGLHAAHLAKITGVTVPAARLYVDLDYSSRRSIDSKFIGNEFLKSVFDSVLEHATGDDELILDQRFNSIGMPRDSGSCVSCSAKIGRPLACYGCVNFRPLLDADHRYVLAEAEAKLAANRAALLNPLSIRTTEKLESQIAWVALTISACDAIAARQEVVDAE